MTCVINKYPNVSEHLFYLSIIIPTVVLFVTVIRIIICIKSTRVFQYKWDSWHPLIVCANIAQFTFWRIDANGGCKRLSERTSIIKSGGGIGIGNGNGGSGATGGGSSASSATVSVRDHLEAGGKLGIIGTRGEIGGCNCGCGPWEEYKDTPHIHHEVLVRGYPRYLHRRDNDKGYEDDNNEYATDATVVDPAVHTMTLYDRVVGVGCV